MLRKRRGFTVLEAVVALAIIGVTSVAVLGAFAGDLRTAHAARSALEASSLAQSRLARLEMATRRELTALPDSLAHGAVPEFGDRYAWSASATLLGAEPDLFELHVVVTWPEGSTALTTRRFRPATLVARP